METIRLCCGKGGCPEVVKEEDPDCCDGEACYKISDDYGGVVKLSAEELDLLVIKWKDPTREWTRESD